MNPSSLPPAPPGRPGSTPPVPAVLPEMRPLTFQENVVLTAKVLAGAAVLLGALCALDRMAR